MERSKVYAVMCHEQYEGPVVYGLYADRDDAEAEVVKLKTSLTEDWEKETYSYSVREYKVY